MSTISTQIERAMRRWESAKRTHDKAMRLAASERRVPASEWRGVDEPGRIYRRLDRLGDAEAARAMIEGAAMGFDPLERIIGANELAGVVFLEGGVQAARAVARVQVRNPFGAVAGFGSGVMISKRLFMTNNHVLPDTETAAVSTIQFGYLSGLAGPREPELFRLQPGVFYLTDEELDFTIVAVEPENAAGYAVENRGWCPLIEGSGKAIAGERVNIIQHPGGERMQVVLRDNTIIGPEGDFLLYRADTQPGSSGSPVFNDQWEMAALHHAGVPERDDQGRILMTNGQPWTGLSQDADRISWIANEGTRISRIVAHVKALTLPAAWSALWRESLMPAAPLDLWQRLETADGGVPGPESGEAMRRGVDADGNPCWYFKLSFGPVGGPGAAAGPQPGAGNGVPSAPARPGATLDERAAAEDILARFSHDGVYYDATEDAAAIAAYYQGVDLEAASAPLFDQLTAHLKDTHTNVHSYSRARHEFLYPAIDIRPEGGLRSVYSDAEMDPVETIAAELRQLTAKAASRGREVSSIAALEAMLFDEALWDEIEAESAQPAFNCEHVVPQSWFAKEKVAKADIHHLFTCDWGCNSFRSNIPYWQFAPEDEGFRENCGQTEGRRKFEPAAGKGSVARATMYFLMRYPGEIGDGDSDNEMPKSRLKVLLDWHRAEPPGEYDRHRNWLTHKAQGNRNPFIDFPDLAKDALLRRGFG